MVSRLLSKEKLDKEDMVTLLSLTNKKDLDALFDAAYAVKVKNCGKKVYFRGIIELSNICSKDCFYCGIRKSNKSVERYFLSLDEIIECARFAYEEGYGSVVLQSGERDDFVFTDFVVEALREIKKIGDGALGITLSLGEQNDDVYKEWFLAGAHRYLLRIETTNRPLYESLHPRSHNYERRNACLSIMKKIGYQVGTGVMIGLPGQTISDLADDILFFRDFGIHMIGMGPYIPHKDTPMADSIPDFEKSKERQLELGLKMVAVTRLALKNVNIAATTALQALSDTGRELGLKAGANIIMPNLTDTRYRAAYQLYDNKPCINENAGMCRGCLEMRIKSIGEEIGYNTWGDSPKFKAEKSQSQ
jgi:biotin synthase